MIALNMVVEKFKESDLDGILECLKEVWAISQISEPALTRFLENDNRLYVIRENGTVIGCATLHLQKKLIRDGGIAGFIEDVVIKKDWRGQGAGEILVRWVVEEAKRMGCYKVTLSCFPERIAFYERCGFSKENITMRYYL